MTANASSRPAPSPLCVLVVDDDADLRDSMAQVVTSLGYRCHVASNGLEAWEILQEHDADIILSDWRMPGQDGLQLCRQVRGRDSDHPYVHFILVTANDDKAHLLEGMRAGADDYIAKPVDREELEARLEAAGRSILANRRLEATAAGLRRDSARNFQAARTDPLTRVSNRLELTEDLRTLAGRAARYRHQYCASLCDIDEFKAYNDHFGHLAGDLVLRKIARTIRGQLRTGDRLYRYGGEEFLAIFPEQSLDEAAVGMRRVLRKVEGLGITHAPNAHGKVVTVSAGIAQLRGDGAGALGTIDEWLRRTDAALYAAKARGRNRAETDDTYRRAAADAQ
jgi:two-component system cell cycle response regulator